MTRNTVLIVICTLLCTITFGQTYEGTIEYDKKKQQAFVIDYNYPPEAVENALVQRIEKLGYSSKTEKGLFNKNKGFIVFRNTVIPEIDPLQRDYVVRVDKRSRKSSDESTLYLVLMSNDQNLMPAMKTDDVARAKQFLNNLLPDIEGAKLELDIRASEESIVKAEKEYKKLQDEKADLEKKQKKNQEEIEKQTKLIETQRTALDALKVKRTPAAAVPKA